MNGNSEGLNAKPSEWPNNDDRPVEKISWEDAQAFLSRLNSIEQTAGRLPNGWKYVLPTEAQWEFACRAGTTTAYSWGDSISSTDTNYAYNGYGTGLQQTADVGQYSSNPWGFFDMHGNVWEWTADWYGSYVNSAVSDPTTGPASGSCRVLRGGCGADAANFARSANRGKRARLQPLLPGLPPQSPTTGKQVGGVSRREPPSSAEPARGATEAERSGTFLLTPAMPRSRL